jgi:hypothetical protein
MTQFDHGYVKGTVTLVLQVPNVTATSGPAESPAAVPATPNTAAPDNLAAVDKSSVPSVATEVPAPVSPPVDSSSSSGRTSSSGGTGNLLAAVVSSVLGACVVAAIAALLVRRHRRSKSKQRQEGLQQQCKHYQPELLPNLAATALVRAISSASTDSSGSQAAGMPYRRFDE